MTAVQSAQRFALDASGRGSVVNLGAPSGRQGEMYIAGKVRAYAAINFNSPTDGDGAGLNLDATGILETIDGSITFALGRNSILQGDVIARGAGRDVAISSVGTLRVQGLVQADDQVILSGGAARRSVWIDTTAKLRTVEAGGGITLKGDQEIYIDGRIETLRDDQTITVNTPTGSIVLTRDFGGIKAAGQLTLNAAMVDLQGAISSTYLSTTAEPEVKITAENTLTLGANLTAASDVYLAAKGQTVIVDAVLRADRIAFGGGRLVTADPANGRGATIVARSGITANLTGALVVNRGTQMGSSGDASSISLTAEVIEVMGEVKAGSDVALPANSLDANAVLKLRPTGANARLEMTARDAITIGSVTATGEARAGSLESTGSITLNGGQGLTARQVGTGLYLMGASTITATDVAGTGSGLITLNGSRDLRLEGMVLATGQGGAIVVNADRRIISDGIIRADQSVVLNGGIKDSLA